MGPEDEIQAAEVRLGLRTGEWEAWDFATWYPDAYRYPSFGRLVAALADEQ